MALDLGIAFQHAGAAADELIAADVEVMRRHDFGDAEFLVARSKVGADGIVQLHGRHAAGPQPRKAANTAGDVFGFARGHDPARAAVGPDHAPGAMLQAQFQQIEGRGAAADHEHGAAGPASMGHRLSGQASGCEQTASMLWPSGPMTNAA